MSIDNLFVPNIYDLFARSITITGVTGPTGPIAEIARGYKILSGTTLISLVGGGQTITGYTVRGVTGTLPAHFDSVAYNVIEAAAPAGDTGTFAMTQITIVIPQFTVTSVSGSGAPNAISFPILPQYAPPFYLNIAAVVETTTGTSALAEVIVFAAGVVYINLPTGTFGPPPFGIRYDINVTWTL